VADPAHLRAQPIYEGNEIRQGAEEKILVEAGYVGSSRERIKRSWRRTKDRIKKGNANDENLEKAEAGG